MGQQSWLSKAVSLLGLGHSTRTKSYSNYDFVSLHQQGKAVWTPRNYRDLAEQAYQKNAVAFRCVRMIAEAAASIPIRVWENGRKFDDHPLETLLMRPNNLESGRQFLEKVYGFLQISGNSYLEMIILADRVRELHVLRPDRIRVLVNAKGWPEAYEHNINGTLTTYRKDPRSGIMPILHMAQFHPGNDHYGMSPVEAAATAIDIHNAASDWNKALLDNGARPSGALVYKGVDGVRNLNPDQIRRLKAELEETYQGPGNAGRPMLLEGGLDWKPLSLTPADLDFINAKNAAAREIALAFGVPPMLLGIPGDNTYSNYREANLSFWRQTVIPLAEKTAEAMTNWLLPLYPHTRLQPDLEDISQLSLERERRWSRISQAGFLTDDEKRRLLGLPETQNTN